MSWDCRFVNVILRSAISHQVLDYNPETILFYNNVRGGDFSGCSVSVLSITEHRKMDASIICCSNKALAHTCTKCSVLENVSFNLLNYCH